MLWLIEVCRTITKYTSMQWISPNPTAKVESCEDPTWAFWF